MKYINKNPEPRFMIEWKEAHPRVNYDSFQRNTELKSQLRNSLLKEQYYLCGYCGTSLKDEVSAHYHIEHIKPRSKFKKRTLDYDNLIVSCNGRDLFDPDVAEKTYCGHKKGDIYSSTMMTPLDADCEERMFMQSDGLIAVTDSLDTQAQEAIDILSLNSYSLKRSRAEVIDELILEIYSAEDEVLEIQNLIQLYSDEDEEGALLSFSQEIISYLDAI